MGPRYFRRICSPASERESGFTSYNPSSPRPSASVRQSDALVSSALIIFAFAARSPARRPSPIPFPSASASVGGGQRARRRRVEYFASNYGPLMNSPRPRSLLDRPSNTSQPFVNERKCREQDVEPIFQYQINSRILTFEKKVQTFFGPWARAYL